MSAPMQRGRQVNSGVNAQLKVFYWVLGVIVLIGAGALVFFAARGFGGGGSNAEVQPVNAPVGTLAQGIPYTGGNGKPATTPSGLYYKGDPNAPVKVIAFEDFQCPGCGNFARILEPGITKDYINTRKVQFVFQDFPLSQHPNAPKAAETARCAGDQGKFWQMHDLLYSRQDAWSENGRAVDLFTNYAGDLGLDRNAFQTCITSGKYTAAINESGMASQNAGISATPSFTVNGQLVQATGLRAAIDAALKTPSK